MWGIPRSKAVAIIRSAIRENPKWKQYLFAFYLLKDEPGIEGLINERSFTEKDWISALPFLEEMGQDARAASLSRKVLQQFPGSSYLHYLLGNALVHAGKQDEAKKNCRMLSGLILPTRKRPLC